MANAARFKLVDVPPGPDSLFAAFSVLRGGGKLPEFYRRIAVEQLLLSNFNTAVNLPRYKANMSVPGKEPGLREIRALSRGWAVNIVVVDKDYRPISGMQPNRNNTYRKEYYMMYADGSYKALVRKNFIAYHMAGPSNTQRRAASIAAAIAEGFPKKLDKKRGPSPGWKSAGTLRWLGQSTGVPLFQKESGGVQKYVRIKDTDDHIYTYKGWKIVGDDLRWVGGKISVKSDKIARAIAEAAIRTPAVAAAVTMTASRAGFFAGVFSRGASAAAVRSVQSNARVANAIRNALEARGVTSVTTGGTATVRKLSSFANAFRRTPPDGGRPPVVLTPGGNPGGGQPSGKPFSNYIMTKNNGTLDLEFTFFKFYNQNQSFHNYSNKDVVTFYNGLIDYILKSEKNKNTSVELITQVLLKLKEHLKAIYNKGNNNARNRLTYYLANLTYEKAKQIAKEFVEQYRPSTTAAKPPPAAKPAFSLPPFFGGRRQNNVYGAINYANRQERGFYNSGIFGAPTPSFNARRAAPSLAGGAPPPPSSLTFPSLPAEQKAAIVGQATKNLTPNQKRVVNTAGGAQLVANIIAKAGGANKVKQAAVALQTYSKNNAVRMGLTTNIAANAVNKLGGPMNAVTAAAITNKIVAAMNKKVTAKRAAVKRRKSKPKAKPAPESPPIRARLLKAMVKKFTKNDLVKIAGENALGAKNNTKKARVANFIKFMRRQPKKKKGSVPEYNKKKTKK